MELSFDQSSGALLIVMDGAQVLEDAPVLAAEAVKRYELSIGDCEKHKLALQLTYGGTEDEPGLASVPRLSLMLSPIAQ